MAKSKSSASTSTGRDENPVVKYFKDTRAELKRVTWPTREETRNLTTIIVIVTIAMAAFLGILDYVFQIVVAGVIALDLVWIGIAVALFAAGAAVFYYNNQEY